MPTMFLLDLDDIYGTVTQTLHTLSFDTADYVFSLSDTIIKSTVRQKITIYVFVDFEL
jgi:hypothetical protein